MTPSLAPAPGVTISGEAQIQGTRLFAPLSLTLGSGQWTCLLGGSGVGKSTVLRLLAGLDTTATFDGVIHADDGADLGARIAYMAQSDLLLPWKTVADNIALGGKLRAGRSDQTRLDTLLGRVGLRDHRNKYPDQLSGGQRQRVALARTLMEDRPVVLLDEPFSALDAQTRADMQELTAELLQGRTVLLVTHDPAEAARLGDSVQIMTPEGLENITVPNTPIPRPVTAPEVLSTQADLLTRLRKGHG